MQNEYYAANFDALLETCRERDIAVQTIKSIALQPWLDQSHTHNTWYRPLQNQEDIDRAVWWVLSRPGIFLNTVGDVNLLPKVLDAASRFEQDAAGLSSTELGDYLARLEFVPLFV
jgi:hypothetical protein